MENQSIQEGIRCKAVYDYVNSWILKMTDITDYVHELNHRRLSSENILNLLPDEKVYEATWERKI